MGIFFAVQYYIPHPVTDKMLTDLAVWFRIISAFALGLGIVSLFHVHFVKIKRRGPAWGFSIIIFVSLFGMLAAGIFCNGIEVSTEAGKLTIYGWLYQNIQVPLQSTMFSILAFYIASAAFKAFRAKTKEATLLLMAGLVVMFGRVPLGELIWESIGQFKIFGINLPPSLGDITGWIMKVPNMAAQGGISLGICLGSIAMALKIIFGIERSYLGGGKQ